MHTVPYRKDCKRAVPIRISFVEHRKEVKQKNEQFHRFVLCAGDNFEDTTFLRQRFPIVTPGRSPDNTIASEPETFDGGADWWQISGDGANTIGVRKRDNGMKYLDIPNHIQLGLIGFRVGLACMSGRREVGFWHPYRTRSKTTYVQDGLQAVHSCGKRLNSPSSEGTSSHTKLKIKC